MKEEFIIDDVNDDLHSISGHLYRDTDDTLNMKSSAT